MKMNIFEQLYIRTMVAYYYITDMKYRRLVNRVVKKYNMNKR